MNLRKILDTTLKAAFWPQAVDRMPGILSIPASVSKETPCAREGAWGCLVTFRCQPCISISPGTKMGPWGEPLSIMRIIDGSAVSACRLREPLNRPAELMYEA